MGILGNYSVLQKSPGHFLSGNVCSDRSNYSKSGKLRNRYSDGGTFPKFSALPNGYVHPYSWSIAQKSGGLAAYRLEGTISTTDALLALGINIDADLSAAMTTTDAILALIVALQADLSASGTITDANMAIIILLEAALSASGSLTDAQLNNILNLASALSASGTLTDVALVNLVNLSADISNAAAGVATPEQIAAAVWNAILADFQDAGSVGEALSNAGSAGNPWDALLSSSTTTGTFGKRLQEVLTKNQFLGLK